MVYDDGAIAGIKADYDSIVQKIMDLTDTWISTMRAGAPPPEHTVDRCNLPVALPFVIPGCQRRPVSPVPFPAQPLVFTAACPVAAIAP